MKLFDYISILFGSDAKWNDLNNYDKIKNDFMTRRFMAIKFPMQANLFNSLKTDPIGQAESWRMISSKFKRVPSWIYTKTKKESTKTDSWKPSQEAVDTYIRLNEIGEREYKEALKYNPDAVKVAVNTLQKQLGNDVN
jgi:hypothetical protein